jgi:NodT family efflux transporter outer membrane factor (OMF) lipoprotein
LVLSRYIRRLKYHAVMLLPGVLLAACAVGPDFQPPEAPATQRYTSTPVASETVSSPGNAGNAQHLVNGAAIPAQWWTLYQSPALNELVNRALAKSPSLVAARATLRVAQENLRAAGGVLAPQVDAGASAGRQRFSPAIIGSPLPPFEFDLYNASIDVGYKLDLAGGARRGLEAIQAETDFHQFQLQAAYIALTANVVTTAIRVAALQAQLESTKTILEDGEKVLDLMERQAAAGGASRADVLSQRAEVAQTRAALPMIKKELARARHLLGVFVGDLPGEAQLPELSLAALTLPGELPVSVPSQLVRERPDILAAEAMLHGASARVGVATASLYPQVMLTGSYGTLSNNTGDLFGSNSMVWNFSAGLTQPLFRGGQLKAQQRAAKAAYEQAAAQYRDVLLHAFQNVADALRALELDAHTLAAQVDRSDAAREALELTRKQYELGGAPYLALINAQRQYQQVRIALVDAQAARFADTAALFLAMGGGWWNEPSQQIKISEEEK